MNGKVIGRLIGLARIVAGVFVLLGISTAGYEIMVYLRTAPRLEVQKLSVSGIKHVKESEVLAKAGFELGTNLFSVKLDDVRRRVEELPWVRYAAVSRTLPDQIMIRIVEREPIGLARIRGEVYEIDADGRILEPDAAYASSFPILEGLRGDEKKNLDKVGVYQRVIQELGQASLSEISIDDSGEATVVSASDPLIVSLGTDEFRARWIKYLHLKPRIEQQYPQAARVDLRFKNQIIIRMKDGDSSEKISWGEKKDTL